MSGAEIRDQNGEYRFPCLAVEEVQYFQVDRRAVMACQTVSNILKSSLGPVG